MKGNDMAMTSRTETIHLMTEAEIDALENEALKAYHQGDFERGNEIARKIPLKPELAMCLATQAGYGPEALKKSGLNLTEADAKYGSGWLERLGK